MSSSAGRLSPASESFPSKLVRRWGLASAAGLTGEPTTRPVRDLARPRRECDARHDIRGTVRGVSSRNGESLVRDDVAVSHGRMAAATDNGTIYHDVPVGSRGAFRRTNTDRRVRAGNARGTAMFGIAMGNGGHLVGATATDSRRVFSKVATRATGRAIPSGMGNCCCRGMSGSVSVGMGGDVSDGGSRYLAGPCTRMNLFTAVNAGMRTAMETDPTAVRNSWHKLSCLGQIRRNLSLVTHLLTGF